MLELLIDKETFEALPDALSAEYKPDGDEFRLDVPNGLVPKAKLDEFRKTNVALKKKVEKFGDLDPEAAREALDRKEEFEAGEGANSPEKIRAAAEALAAERVSKMKTTHAEQLATKDGTIGRLNGSLNDRVVGDALRKAGSDLGVHAGAVDDLISRGKAVFAVDSDGNLIALDSDGETPRLNDRGDAFSAGDFVGGLKKSAAHLFGETSGSGSSGSSASQNVSGAQGPNPWAKESFNLTDQGKILKADPKLAQRLAAKAGKVIKT